VKFSLTSPGTKITSQVIYRNDFIEHPLGGLGLGGLAHSRSESNISITGNIGRGFSTAEEEFVNSLSLQLKGRYSELDAVSAVFERYLWFCRNLQRLTNIDTQRKMKELIQARGVKLRGPSPTCP
jgi:hypothetical protein